MNDSSKQTGTDSADALAAGLMFTCDLFFGSKVTGTAAELGFRVDMEGDVSRGLSKLSDGNYRCIILDLAMPGLVPSDVMDRLPAENRPCVIAFGSHVNTVRLKQARGAGCDEVLPRSRFSAELPEILTRYCGDDVGPGKKP
jgi:CheY-like chemotaxis protein